MSSSPEEDSSSSNSTSATNRKVPRRPFGILVNNERLSPTLPIIGLGCSSFSTFFWSKEDDEKASQQQQQESSSSSPPHPWEADTIDHTHPVVQEWIQTIHEAILEHGITLLDTAPWYGHGTSEVVIGWAMQELLVENNTSYNPQSSSDDGSMPLKKAKTRRRIPRHELVINTKIGRYEADPIQQFDFSKDATLASVQRSLQRMKCKYINVLQLHDPEFAPSLEQLLHETIPAMVTCRSNGWCCALGMTGYPLEVQYQILQRTLDKDTTPSGSSATCIWDQALTYGHFNLHDQSLVSQPILKIEPPVPVAVLQYSQENEDNREKDDDDDDIGIAHPSFASFCQSHNLGLLAAAPLSMGLFTKRGPPDWHPASSELVEACRAAVTICNNHHVDISSLAMLVALSNPVIPCTLIGMKNVAEVEAAAATANRFHKVVVGTAASENDDADEDNHSRSSWQDILKQVLTKEEYTVWEQLNDPEEGPFATVWKNGTYRWDGIRGVKAFWDQVKQVDAVAWQATSM
jgi:L-galactose dehydrogenase